MQTDELNSLDLYKDTEKEMQVKLSRFLEEQGFHTFQEVQLSNKGRADIIAVINNTTYIIECKKRLTRDNFYRANGQVSWYASHRKRSYEIFKTMIVYGGDKRVSFDNGTIDTNTIVMWYYDALHFFNAYSSSIPPQDENSEIKEYPTYSINPDPITALRKIPAFATFATEKMSEDPEFWRNEAKHGTGIFNACATAVVAIGKNNSILPTKSQEEQS